jgi:hypothetical protein
VAIQQHKQESSLTASNATILWHIDPLLANDRETNNETTAVVRKQPACQWTSWKAVSSVGFVLMAANTTMDTTMGMVLPVWFMPRCYKQDN